MGLGGFFDGIVLHQWLQWHHMATSAGYPPDSVANLRLNILFDGGFFALAFLLLGVGLVLLWLRVRRGEGGWSGAGVVAALLIGFGLFNLVEGTVNHHLLGLHHVNETVARRYWIWWDLGFLVWGAGMLGLGILLWRQSGVNRSG